MRLHESLEWSAALNLAYRVAHNLDAMCKVVEDRNNNEIEITGKLPLSNRDFTTNKRALCIFRINAQWPWQTPDVICCEDWIKKGIPDWHINTDGNLCFEFSKKWMNELPPMVDEYSLGLTSEYASTWLVNSSRSLLNRHLFAFRNGIKDWPKAWDFWAHDKEMALRQFMESQKHLGK